MNNELQAAKDQAAREAGWENWKHISEALHAYRMDEIINRAMEIYAEMVLKSRKKKSKINPYEPTGFKAINSKTTKP